MPKLAIKHKLEAALDCTVTAIEPLSVGFELSGHIISLQDGRKAAVKVASTQSPPSLSLEGYMLESLRSQSKLPVPKVYYSDDSLLIMEWIEGRGRINVPLQHHAAELLAELHHASFAHFGFERDTLIGPLHQPNIEETSWVTFFTQHRLLYMAQQAHKEASLPSTVLKRLEALAHKLPSLLHEPAHPALLHGDLWTGNIIADDNKVAGFIDPAIYYGHPEIELAFTTLFGTFNKAFFDAYENISPLEPDFHETRLDIYNLYPLLVHVRLFGASYIPQIITVLDRHGV